jgi:hypothetical protein
MDVWELEGGSATRLTPVTAAELRVPGPLTMWISLSAPHLTWPFFFSAKYFPISEFRWMTRVCGIKSFWFSVLRNFFPCTVLREVEDCVIWPVIRNVPIRYGFPDTKPRSLVERTPALVILKNVSTLQEFRRFQLSYFAWNCQNSLSNNSTASEPSLL